MNRVSREAIEAFKEVGHDDLYIDDMTQKYGGIETKYEALFVAAVHMDPDAFQILLKRLRMPASVGTQKVLFEIARRM